MDKSVLFIIKSFSPPLTGGTIRVHKFAKYLIRDGWNVFILCNSINKLESLKQNNSLYSELSGIHICDAPGIDIFLKSFISKRRGKTFTHNENSHYKITPLSDLLRFLFSKIKYAITPDIWYFLWVPFAIRKAKSIIKQYNIKNILTSSPSHSTQLIGYSLKKSFSDKIRWIADFRDLWSLSPEFVVNKNKLNKHKYFERKIISLADKTIFNTKSGLHFNLSNLDIPFNPTRHYVITNGFDEEDFLNLKSIPNVKGPHLIFSYIGSVYGTRMNCLYVEAIKLFANRYPNYNVFFSFVGVCTPEFIKRVEKLSCPNIILEGPTSHNKALEKMFYSDVLVAFWNDSIEGKIAIAGKIYEYLRAQKPILALFPDGEVTNLIKTNNLGEVAHPGNIEDIITSIFKLVNNLSSNPSFYSVIKKESIQMFSRKYLTEKLSLLLRQ